MKKKPTITIDCASAMIIKSSIRSKFDDLMADIVCGNVSRRQGIPFLCGWLAGLRAAGLLSEDDMMGMYEEVLMERRDD